MTWRVICEGLSDDPCDWVGVYRHLRDVEAAGKSHADETGHPFAHIELDEPPAPRTQEDSRNA